MISHEHKFIFIHSSKTGGSSIEKALDPFCIGRVVSRGGHYQVRYKGLNLKHYSFAMYQSLFSEDLSKYKVVYTLRNPWARVLSAYTYQKSLGREAIHGKAKNFEEYLNRHRIDPKFGNGNIIDMIEGCDFNITLPIIFNDLRFHFEDICENFLGLPKIRLPHLLHSDHGHYREYYNEEMRSIIDERFAKDIEFFGFQFGEGS